MGDQFVDKFNGKFGPPRSFSRQAAVKALKESVQGGHKTGLPQNLLKLFDARPPLPKPVPIKKRPPKLPLSGLSQLVQEFAAPGDPEYEPPPPADRPPSPRLYRNRELVVQCRLDTETKAEKKKRLSEWKKEEAERACSEAVKNWDPNKDPKVESDPFKTIVVAHLSYDVTEKKLRKEFEEFGPVKRVRIVTDLKGKPRGYAFVEFEHKKDMKEAYKIADGRKIEGRRVVVDVERGRTVENWRPRRLGGGLGGEGRAAKLPKKAALAAGLPVPPEDDRRMMVDSRPPREDFYSRDRPPRDDFVRDRPRDDFRGPPRPDFRERERSPIRPRDDGYRPRDDRDRRDYDRKREREPSPRRDRDRDDKRRRDMPEEGEVRDGRDRRDGSSRRRERDML